MATIPLPTSTRNHHALNAYATQGEAHFGEGARALHVSGVNCFAETAMNEFSDTLSRYGKLTPESVKSWHIIQSFTKDELDPESADDIETAHTMGVKFAKKSFPGFQAVVTTQRDGKSGLLHNHIQVCSVAFKDYEFERFEKELVPDEDEYEPPSVVWTPAKVKRRAGTSVNGDLKNAARLRRINDDLVKTELGYDNKELMKTPEVRITSYEQSLADDAYNWREDMRARIYRSSIGVVNDDEFISQAWTQEQVEVRMTGKTRNLSYHFIDKDGKNRTVRAKNLGADFMRDSIDASFKENIATRERLAEMEKNRKAKQQQATTVAEPPTAPAPAPTTPTPRKAARATPAKPTAAPKPTTTPKPTPAPAPAPKPMHQPIPESEQEPEQEPTQEPKPTHEPTPEPDHVTFTDDGRMIVPSDILAIVHTQRDRVNKSAKRYQDHKREHDQADKWQQLSTESTVRASLKVVKSNREKFDQLMSWVKDDKLDEVRKWEADRIARDQAAAKKRSMNASFTPGVAIEEPQHDDGYGR